MNRRNQLGGVISFIVIGIILVSVAWLALYGLRQLATHQSEPPISTDIVATNNNESETSASGTEATSTDQSSRSNQSENSTSNSSNSENSSSDSDTQVASTNGDDTALPETGPVDMIAAALSAGILTFVGVAYYRSRFVL